MRFLSISSLIFLSVFTGQVSGQTPFAAAEGLVHRSGSVHVGLVLGRLRLDQNRYNKTHCEVTQEFNGGTTEYLNVTSQLGIPSLHYARHTSEERLHVDVLDGAAATIHWQTAGDAETGMQMTLTQPKQGPLRLEFQQRGEQFTWEGDSLWHLYVSQPELCDQWISPVLRLLVKDFEPVSLLANVEQQLRQRVQVAPTLSVDQVGRWVGDLASPSRAERVRAHQTLLQQGIALLPFLARLDLETLDAEQRCRIHILERQLQPSRTDEAEHLASWLGADPAYCQCMAERWTLAERQQLHRYLQTSCGRGLPESLLESVDAAAAAVQVALSVQP